MTTSVHIYLTVLLWMGIVNVLVGAMYLVADHPRERRPANVGTDLLALMFSLSMLAWTAVLLYA